MQAVLAHNVADRVGELGMPVLIMHGDADLMMPIANGRALAAALPNAQFVDYPGAGHLFFVEQAAKVNEDLRRFFNQGR